MEVFGSHVAQRDAVLCEQFGEGVDSTAVFQISHHSYLSQKQCDNISCCEIRITLRDPLFTHSHSVDRPQLFPDGEDIQQRLGWVLPNAIPSIDHWFTTLT